MEFLRFLVKMKKREIYEDFSSSLGAHFERGARFSACHQSQPLSLVELDSKPETSASLSAVSMSETSVKTR